MAVCVDVQCCVWSRRGNEVLIGNEGGGMRNDLLWSMACIGDYYGMVV